MSNQEYVWDLFDLSSILWIFRSSLAAWLRAQEEAEKLQRICPT